MRGAQFCAPLLTAPILSALGKQSPHFLCTGMQPMLVPLGRVVPVAPELLSWLQALSSMWALQVQKHFTLRGVWGGGYSWKGNAGSYSLPAVICQIISLQPAQMLVALGVCLGCWKSSQGPHGSAWCPQPGACSLHSSYSGQHGPSTHSPSRK